MPSPVILAGPILRRCDSDRVIVWLATSHPFQVTGHVHVASTTQQGQRLGEGQARTIPLGARLHIALVTIPPLDDGAFPIGQLLDYDLELAPTNDKGRVTGDALPLSAFEPPGDTTTLAYPPYGRPTFFLADERPLNLLHGSCRKPHGDGDDALAVADLLLADDPRDLDARPAALFLTGDQIYADNVDDTLAQAATDLGEILLGFAEPLPAPWGGTTLPPLRSLRPGSRGLLVATIFTPDDPLTTRSSARNQLLGFGEFAAMYLLAWNPAIWPDEMRAARSLAECYRVLPQVRRALANIPVYMVMDDHEVTDDWNLNRAWEERVGGNPLGRRVVTNAMAAYWAFQGWGNDPDRFPNDFARPLVGYVASQGIDAAGYEHAFYPANPDPDDADGGAKPSIWQYSALTSPPVTVLDCRTRRGFNPRSHKDPARLLGGSAVRQLAELLAASDLANEPVILVAPTPVLGIPGMESVQENPATQTAMEVFVGQSGAAASDLESWHASRPGLYRLLFTIHDAGARTCVILSGDLHYGFATTALFHSARGLTVFTQLTFSALKNRTGLAEVAELAAKRLPVHLEYAWRSLRDLRSAVPGASLDAIVRGQSTRDASSLSETDPVALSAGELKAARLAPSAAQAQLLTFVRPTVSGAYVVTDSNLGQLRLTQDSADADAVVAFYQAHDTLPARTFKIPLHKVERSAIP